MSGPEDKSFTLIMCSDTNSVGGGSSCDQRSVSSETDVALRDTFQEKTSHFSYLKNAPRHGHVANGSMLSSLLFISIQINADSMNTISLDLHWFGVIIEAKSL
ncbi:hypothetical protein EYF80_033198 [Liparis tanakae]|uniref:Uncharacterized protein n=1 Tax=Liparis tanakae TaxID=230148 RepID=A0A4Z2GUX3_9TELE|nr:hypothetical protein EYF80_033198 [Liparis tanakae]